MIIFHKINEPQVAQVFHEKTQVKPHCLSQFSDLKGNAVSLTTSQSIASLNLDAGALSGTKGRGRTDIMMYCHYIKAYGNKFGQVFSYVDSSPDPEHHFINHCYLLDNLPKESPLVPFITDHSNPLEELEIYAEFGHDYVAIKSDPEIYHDETVNSIIEKFPRMRFHVYGDLNVKMLVAVKAYSADTSFLIKKAGNEIIFFWHPERHERLAVYVGERKKYPTWAQPWEKFEFRTQLMELLSQTLNYTWEELLTDKYARKVVNMYCFQQMEQYINNQLQETVQPETVAAQVPVQPNPNPMTPEQISQAQA